MYVYSIPSLPFVITPYDLLSREDTGLAGPLSKSEFFGKSDVIISSAWSKLFEPPWTKLGPEQLWLT